MRYGIAFIAFLFSSVLMFAYRFVMMQKKMQWMDESREISVIARWMLTVADLIGSFWYIFVFILFVVCFAVAALTKEMSPERSPEA